ncbi:hypothetical protein MBEHAL_0302 [Halarchaeum acidiphilum MH1-52-1]|uniref:Uncharacterized protein n=1 Tax=Halarchaeum acidiphilum MH1-52-1 TaxID=1261545 RepID=U2YS22_9EURY|nr:hypothetical protein MBEHAL_0302 [Halarchaeum acidiphilum MH1-52-1]
MDAGDPRSERFERSDTVGRAPRVRPRAVRGSPDEPSLVRPGVDGLAVVRPREYDLLRATGVGDVRERLASVGRFEEDTVRAGLAAPRPRRVAGGRRVETPADERGLPEVAMVEVGVEARPRPPGVRGAVEAAAAGRDVLLRADDEDVVDVVLEAVAALRPRLAAVVADVDTADLDARDHAVGPIRMHAETPDVRFVPVTRRVPVVPRREVLEPVQLAPRLAQVGRDVEMRGVRARVEPLPVRASDDRIHFRAGDVEVRPRVAAVARTIESRRRRGEHARDAVERPHAQRISAVEHLLGVGPVIVRESIHPVSRPGDDRHGGGTLASHLTLGRGGRPPGARERCLDAVVSPF